MLKKCFGNHVFKGNTTFLYFIWISVKKIYFCKKLNRMYWTLELASKLEDAPWPATKDELIEWAIRTGVAPEVIENLREIEDEGEAYDRIEDLWPDYPTKEDFFFNEDEY